MTKHYTYVFHLKDGTSHVTPVCRDLVRLRKEAMCLLTKLDLEPIEDEIQRRQASAAIAELRESEKLFASAIKAAAKEKRPSKLAGSGSMAHLKEPGKKLGSSWEYQKQWREKRKAELALSPEAAVQMKLAKQKAGNATKIAKYKEQIAVAKEAKKALLKQKPGCYTDPAYLDQVRKQKRAEFELDKL